MKRESDSRSPAGRPSALFLAPEAPYPSFGGGALRSASLHAYLAQRYNVDLIVFRQPGEAGPVARFPAGTVRDSLVLDLPRNARHVPAKVLRNAVRAARRIPPLIDRFSGFAGAIEGWLRGRRYDVAVIEHFWCAPYWKQVAPVSARTVLDLHNIESVLHARCAASESGPAALAHRVFERACRRREAQWLPCFSSLLAASEEDRRMLEELAPGTEVLVYRNAIPRVPLPRVEEEDALVFSGNLEYHPNISAVRFFRREIWPCLRARWPGLVWRLVGKNPEAVRRFTQGDDRIQLSGPVEDAISEIARAKVAVVPLLAGSGTRIKIMEAWAAARPVVSTRLGAEGLPARDGENILLADNPQRFCEAVSALLASPGLRSKLGRAGRVLFERECTWEAAWSDLNL